MTDWNNPRCASKRHRHLMEPKTFWNAAGRLVGERLWCPCEDRTEAIYGHAWGPSYTIWDGTRRQLIPVESGEPRLPQHHPLHPDHHPPAVTLTTALADEVGDAWEPAPELEDAPAWPC